jgi:transposase, IS5 family
MRPRERRESGEQDLFRSRLDQIIDMSHALVKLARTIEWRFLEERFGAVYTDKPGQPPLPTRLMAGLAILKYSYDLSDEALCDRWVENPYFQFFCGEDDCSISADDVVILVALRAGATCVSFSK